MAVSSTRSELLKKRVNQFQHALDALESGEVRALHQARVASRRLRELAPLLQLDRSKARKLRDRLRKITSRLGPVRELDVLLIQIDELHVAGRRGSSGLGRVGVRVSKARDEARKRLFAEQPTSRMARFARKLDRIADAMAEAEHASSKAAARSWRWAIDARVAKRARRLADAITDAGAVYLPERLHSVRIALKKLRYAVELATEAGGRRADRRPSRCLKRGQDLLGRLHDVQMLIEHVRQTQASLTPPSVAIWRELDVLIASLEDDCRRLHAPIHARAGRAHARRGRRGEQVNVSSGGPQARRAG